MLVGELLVEHQQSSDISQPGGGRVSEHPIPDPECPSIGVAAGEVVGIDPATSNPRLTKENHQVPLARINRRAGRVLNRHIARFKDDQLAAYQPHQVGAWRGGISARHERQFRASVRRIVSGYHEHGEVTVQQPAVCEHAVLAVSLVIRQIRLSVWSITTGNNHSRGTDRGERSHLACAIEPCSQGSTGCWLQPRNGKVLTNRQRNRGCDPIFHERIHQVDLCIAGFALGDHHASDSAVEVKRVGTRCADLDRVTKRLGRANIDYDLGEAVQELIDRGRPVDDHRDALELLGNPISTHVNGCGTGTERKGARTHAVLSSQHEVGVGVRTRQSANLRGLAGVLAQHDKHGVRLGNVGLGGYVVQIIHAIERPRWAVVQIRKPDSLGSSGALRGVGQILRQVIDRRHRAQIGSVLENRVSKEHQIRPEDVSGIVAGKGICFARVFVGEPRRLTARVGSSHDVVIDGVRAERSGVDVQTRSRTGRSDIGVRTTRSRASKDRVTGLRVARRIPLQPDLFGRDSGSNQIGGVSNRWRGRSIWSRTTSNLGAYRYPDSN